MGACVTETACRMCTPSYTVGIMFRVKIFEFGSLSAVFVVVVVVVVCLDGVGASLAPSMLAL